ncbi:pyrokinin-1 receptor-like [Mya arenaria]|nr:pyrokinin-1 receptor-like [Mya arenaria]
MNVSTVAYGDTFNNIDYEQLGDILKQLRNGSLRNLTKDDLGDLSWILSKSRTNHASQMYRDVWDYLEDALGRRRGPVWAVVAITCVYCLIFLSGLFGNICTCLVIAKNKYMHTATNYYLFNLAVADLVLLIIGLPPETYSIWSAYPWIFGKVFCVARTMMAEMSTNASILTITAFTIERYVAICHPLKAHTMSGLKRVVHIIVVIWLLAAVSSIPLTLQFKVVYAVDPWNRTIPESAYCGIGENNHIERTFELSTFVFFVFPMTLVTVLYSMIAIAIRKSGFIRDGSDALRQERLTGTDMRAQQQTRARQSVLKMLVAVVVAFFVCWAPFHGQRLMTLYISASKWTDDLLDLHKIIYYISGVLYFASCTINPFLYSIMSLKFRQAFKQTVLTPNCCRQRVHSTKKRTYFSYRFSHKNGYSETSFTSVDAAFPRGNKEHNCHIPKTNRIQGNTSSGRGESIEDTEEAIQVTLENCE